MASLLLHISFKEHSNIFGKVWMRGQILQSVLCIYFLVHTINQVFLVKENFMHYKILKGPKSQIISRLRANILGQSYSDDVSLSDDQSCKIKVRTRMTLTFSFSQQRKCKTCSVKLEKLFEAFIKIGWVCEFPVVTKFHPWQVQEQRKSLKVSPNFARIETHLRLPPGLTKQTLYMFKEN